MTQKPINLDDLLSYQSVSIKGREVPIVPVNAKTLPKLCDVDFNNISDPVEIYRTAHLFVPSLSEDELHDLTPAQINAICVIASQNVAEVEALFPNLKAPTEATAQPSAE